MKVLVSPTNNEEEIESHEDYILQCSIDTAATSIETLITDMNEL